MLSSATFSAMPDHWFWLRPDEYPKAVIKRAAELSGLSYHAFVLRSSVFEAESIVPAKELKALRKKYRGYPRTAMRAWSPRENVVRAPKKA